MSNTGPTGSLDYDRFLRAMLQLRNTADPDCNISPAQIVFGRPLRDTLSFVNRLEKLSNPNVRPLRRQAWAAKEEVFRSRISRTTESLKEHPRPLRPLVLGERVFIQNQQGTSPNKWDRSGIVVESSGHDQYQVKVDGSGRLTSRNRRSSVPIPRLTHPSSCCLRYHRHHLALATPSAVATTATPPCGIRPTSFDAPTTLPGATHSSIPITCSERRDLVRPYSSLLQRCTDPGTSSNTGCGTRAFVTPARVTTPLS